MTKVLVKVFLRYRMHPAVVFFRNMMLVFLSIYVQELNQMTQQKLKVYN